MISICTPTYNRDYTLNRLYESLLKQSCQEFEWIIIDDGSTDNTKELVNNWIEDNKIKIQYIYQSNQGKHVALNKGIDTAKGEIFTCLDSDDWLYTHAIKRILGLWSEIKKENGIIGIISLDSFENGEIIGSKFPTDLRRANWIDLVFKYKMTGDKDYYFKTNEIRNFKFPTYKNNKHMPPSYQYYLMSKRFDFYLLNKPTKNVEYLEDGISKNKYRKYIKAPDNFARYRLEIMNLIPSYKRKVINAIHFNASQSLGTVKMRPKEIFNILLVCFTKPLGYMLAIYIKMMNKENEG